MKNRTTSKHFKIFKKEAELWLTRLSLRDWKVVFDHVIRSSSENALACINCDIGGRVATITLNKNWGLEDVTVYQLRRTAFHEVGELLVARLGFLGECRYLQTEEIPEERHNIVRRLENLFYGNTSSKTIKKV